MPCDLFISKQLQLNICISYNSTKIYGYMENYIKIILYNLYFLESIQLF